LLLNFPNSYGHARITWILPAAKVPLPCPAGGLTQPPITIIQTMSQAGDHFESGDLPLDGMAVACPFSHSGRIKSRKQAERDSLMGDEDDEIYRFSRNRFPVTRGPNAQSATGRCR
jgi:hypothetical protein